MSFLCDALYLVEPLPALAERLRQYGDPGLADVLLEPQVFRRREGGNSDWLHADREEAAKLLFLASLRGYTPLDEPAGFAGVFGSAVVSTAVFDRWFRVRRFEVEQELELMEPELRECPLPVQPTGRAVVDQWLARVRGRRDGSIGARCEMCGKPTPPAPDIATLCTGCLVRYDVYWCRQCGVRCVTEKSARRSDDCGLCQLQGGMMDLSPR